MGAARGQVRAGELGVAWAWATSAPCRGVVFSGFGRTGAGLGSFFPGSPPTTLRSGDWSWSRTRAPVVVAHTLTRALCLHGKLPALLHLPAEPV